MNNLTSGSSARFDDDYNHQLEAEFNDKVCEAIYNMLQEEILKSPEKWPVIFQHLEDCLHLPHCITALSSIKSL